ncbi:MAG: hypothetical protein RLZZ210_1385 [Pseudomonadota bacterium]|jgi:Fic family protein
MNNNFADKILSLIGQYYALEVEKSVDFTKFNTYLISHHSTSIEGSTLTYVETTVLLEDGLTPKGKPLVHTLMQTDHYDALKFTLNQAKNISIYTPEFIQNINAKVMHSTGQIYNTALGTVDATKGEYRKGTVFAGQTTFVNFNKITKLVQNLCQTIKSTLEQKTSSSIIEQLIFSFKMHYELVYIHPFYDGNGRTSRLIMNAVQSYYNLPLAIVFSEDKVDYIQSLIDAKQKEDINIFIEFMMSQYCKHLEHIINSITKA